MDVLIETVGGFLFHVQKAESRRHAVQALKQAWGRCEVVMVEVIPDVTDVHRLYRMNSALLDKFLQAQMDILDRVNDVNGIVDASKCEMIKCSDFCPN